VHVRAPLLGAELQKGIDARQAVAPEGVFPAAGLAGYGFEINNLNLEI
jgi:hypothetical protein